MSDHPCSGRCRAFAAVFALFLAGGCVNPLPKVGGTAEQNEPAAWVLIEASAEAHGGKAAFSQLTDVAVSYDGEWLNRIWKMQPVLVDRGFRQRSEERVLPKAGVVAQRHVGPEGTKQVTWDGTAARVVYRGTTPDDQAGEPAAEAAALVAEAYRMFLTGPFYFLNHPGPRDARVEKTDTVDGVMCDQVLVRLVPGLGTSEEDRVLLAIGRDDRLLRRVRFSLNGFRGTRRDCGRDPGGPF